MTSAENTTYNIRLSDIADKEIENAITYYSSKSESGTNNFKMQLNQVLDTLELNPFFSLDTKKLELYPLNHCPIWCFLKFLKMKI